MAGYTIWSFGKTVFIWDNLQEVEYIIIWKKS